MHLFATTKFPVIELHLVTQIWVLEFTLIVRFCLLVSGFFFLAFERSTVSRKLNQTGLVQIMKYKNISLTNVILFFLCSFLQIHLDPEEFIVKVSGTFHPCAWDKSIPNVVSSLTLVTNTGKTHGPFGKQIGADFHVPMGSNSRIVGFFAHGGNYIEAIGAYVRTL